MSEKRYELLKDYEDPCGRVYKGAIRTEYQWMSRFALLNEGDCATKTDWFREFPEHTTEPIPSHNDPYEQIAKNVGLSYIKLRDAWMNERGDIFKQTLYGFTWIGYEANTDGGSRRSPNAQALI